jgi:hypothetical protein
MAACRGPPPGAALPSQPGAVSDVFLTRNSCGNLHCAVMAACRGSASGAVLPAQAGAVGDVFLTEPERAEILRVWESKVGRVL